MRKRKPARHAGPVLLLLLLLVGCAYNPYITPDEGAPALPDAAGAGPASSAAVADPGTDVFRESFDGDPPAPRAWSSPRWDILVHSRNRDTWAALDPINAHHGPGCEPPPATHPVTAYADAVYQCKNHVMTAINAGGYGVIYLTPNHLVDFSAGTAEISFDISTLRSSGRDWIDIWITPYEDNLVHPLQTFLPDLAGPPRRGIHISMAVENGPAAGGRFQAALIDGHQMTELPVASRLDYATLLTPDARQRSTFVLQLSRERIRFGLPAHDLWWVDAEIPPLDWSQGIVQLGHHAYNPEKACRDEPGCGPNTWHWDNVRIAPAVPFTMIAAGETEATPDAPRLTFATPAPSRSHLRFSAIGENLEISVDGGRSWVPAARQAQLEAADGRFQSYWHPLPAGADSVLLRGDDWYGGDWRVRGAAVWSRQSPGGGGQVTP